MRRGALLRGAQRAVQARGALAPRAPAFHTSVRTLERHTRLYDFHKQHGAKLVPFGGYSMPLSYGDVGQVASHKHVREHAGLFDVGHMVQHMCVGGVRRRG